MKRCLWICLLLITACGPMYQAGKFYQQNDYPETLRYCRRAVAADSTNVNAWTLMGKVYLALGHPDSARQVLETAMALQPAGEIKILLAGFHEQEGDTLAAAEKYWKALDAYQTALAYDSTSVVLEKIADTYVTVGKHDNAVEYYQSVLAWGGDSTSVSQKLAQLDSSSQKSSDFYRLGTAALEAYHYQKAINLLQKAVALKPDDIDSKYALHMATGHRLYRKGSQNALWDAISSYGLAAALKTGLAEPHYFMGMAYHKKDRDEYDNAISEFEIAIQKQPESKYAKQAAKKIRDLKARRKKMKEFWGR